MVINLVKGSESNAFVIQEAPWIRWVDSSCRVTCSSCLESAEIHDTRTGMLEFYAIHGARGTHCYEIESHKRRSATITKMAITLGICVMFTITIAVLYTRANESSRDVIFAAIVGLLMASTANRIARFVESVIE